MFSNFYAKCGRHYKATCHARGRQIPSEVLPPDIVVLNCDDERLSGKSRHSIPLVLECFDCQVADNTVAHKTDQYVQTFAKSDDSSSTQLVVRRGQRFKFAMRFSRPYKPTTDDISFTFQFGEDDASISTGSRITVRLSQGIKPNSWSAGLLTADDADNSIIVQLLSPANGIVGRATVIIDTELNGLAVSSSSSIASSGRHPSAHGEEEANEEEEDNEEERRDSARNEDDAEEEEEEEEEENENGETEDDTNVFKKHVIVRYEHHQPIYFLFNPWNKDDQVFLADEDQRNQYVLNDFGRLFYGTQYLTTSRPWHYGQFELGVLDCCFHLLDMARLRPSSRSNAASVVRTVAKLINAVDDHGLMVASWSGSYADGTPPTQWIGSAAILNEFMKSKEPVKYGQCWIFSAVATTICRAMGIPTRCVTNFGSAHDCDGVNTINIHWNLNGEPMDEWNSESVWSFHLWNEAYMTRPDINAGLSGCWQAFDVTPQAASDGLYFAGPCPVMSLKKGDISQRYDSQLIFFELNTDIIHWTLQEDGRWRTTVEKNRTGRRLVTEDPSGGYQASASQQRPACSGSMQSVFNSRGQNIVAGCLDITNQYKYPEGSEEERASLQRASTPFTYPPVYDKGDGDVKFELVQREPLAVGTEFSIVVNAQNTSRFERTVTLTLTVVACYYTGFTKTKLKSQKFNFNLCSLRNRQLIMRVSPEDYSYIISEFTIFRAYMLAVVEETEQLTTSFSDFILTSPEINITGSKTARLGESSQYVVELLSPMLVGLHNCKWMIQASGMHPTTQVIEQSELEPYEKASVRIKLSPQRTGKLTIMASFHSHELTGLTGIFDVNVTD